MTTVFDPRFWVVLGTLTVLGAATAMGLTAALERLVDRLQERHAHRPRHGGGAHAH